MDQPKMAPITTFPQRPESTTDSAPSGVCEKCGGTGTYKETSGNQGQYVKTLMCLCPAGDVVRQAKWEQAREDEKGRAEVQRQYRLAEALKDAEIPKRYKDARVSTFDDAAARAALEKWKDANPAETGRGLYVWGPVGCGKSHLAAAVLNFMIQPDYSGWFVPVSTVLDRVRSSYDEKGHDDPMEKLYKKGILVLDDIGGERVTDWVLERLFVIVNERYNRMLVTIATSNLEPKELSAHLGDRTVSRLMGMCDVIHLEGHDRRVAG